MYEQHFGLAKRPFSARATGTEVFVGPQTAKTMAGFRKALVAQDAVVTVSGPVGTGKTTLVERALDAIGTKYKTIRVGRMQMNSSDVLEALLVVLGVQDRPAGTIQRFAALRRRLKELQDAETRVFVLIEDAPRAGVETLAELEALTVGDAGESDGASIVLMGDETLFDFMRDPRLARLQQRVRRRHQINPLCVGEMLGYLKHSFRSAGGDYERIFDVHSAELIHYLSEGIPRVANNIVDSVLDAGAAAGLETIPATLIASIALEEFGLSAEGFEFSTAEPVADDVDESAPQPEVESGEQAEPQPGTAVEAAVEPAPQSEPVANVAEESLAQPMADVVKKPVPPAEPATKGVEDPSAQLESRTAIVDESVPAADVSLEAPSEHSREVVPGGSNDEPYLINDTLPDLAILSERYATLPEVEAEADPKSESEIAASENKGSGPAARSADPDQLPELEPIATTEHGQAGTGGPSPETTAAAEELARETDALHPSVPVAENVASVESDPVATTQSATDEIPPLEPDPAPRADDDSESIPELEPEPIAATPSEPEDIREVEPASAPPAKMDFDNIPELEPDPVAAIQPKPDINSALEPDSAAAAESDSDSIPELEPEPIAATQSEPDSIPELEPNSAAAAESNSDDSISELEPDPVAATQSEPDSIPELEPEPIAAKQIKPDPLTAVGLSAKNVSEVEPNPVAASIFAPENAQGPEQGPKTGAKTDVTRSPEAEREPIATTQSVPGDMPEQAPGVAPVAESNIDNISEPNAEPIAVAKAAPVAPESPIDEPATAEEPFADNILELELTPETELGSDPAPDADPDQQIANEDPEWDRDPTFAQLKPDLEALENAMAFAHGKPDISTKLEDAAVQPESLADSVVEQEDLPEITLDKSIETGIQDQLIEEPSDILPPARAKKPDVELERIAANIANAKTLEDMDDIMAETLFGTGISMIAAQIKMNPPSNDVADVESQVVAETPPHNQLAESELQLVAETPTNQGAAERLAAPTKPPPAVAMQREDISIETPAQAFNGGLMPTATQRLKTVRALNAEMNSTPRKRGKAKDSSALDEGNEPEPIEDQINTSITQTLKALEIAEDLIDDEPEEEPKRGFFSRFRKSKG